MIDDKFVEDVDSRCGKVLSKLIPSISENIQSPEELAYLLNSCLLYTSPSPRDGLLSRMPSSA